MCSSVPLTRSHISHRKKCRVRTGSRSPFFLKRHIDVQEIVLRLDNDAVGRGAAGAISQAISDLPVSVELPAEGKDYNEWLMRQKGISPRQRARNEPER